MTTSSSTETPATPTDASAVPDSASADSASPDPASADPADSSSEPAAGTVDPATATATPIPAESRYDAPTSTSGQLAESDPTLLTRTDRTEITVMVKLDYDVAASYDGSLAGLPATSPQVTGEELTGDSPAEQHYQAYTDDIDSQFRDSLSTELPQAEAGTSLTTVYGGLAVRIPADQAKDLLDLPGVAAIQSDTLYQTDELTGDSDTTDWQSPQFIGSKQAWQHAGGQSLAGRGVIFADVDTGIWPEHPMLADTGRLGSPPAAPSGQQRACVFGDNPLTPKTDVFRCNNKVIGGQPFLATYNSLWKDQTYPDSARDSQGHGTHTTTTAAGIGVGQSSIFGIERGPVSGVAPGAWVLAYKVCGIHGCYSSDSAAAIQQAIRDGADVINFSIAGGTDPYKDPAEMAMLDAYNAGVFVAASAGNDGPTAGTAEHVAPWVTTVAASTQKRQFTSQLTLTGDGVRTTLTGASLTTGISTPTRVVLAQNIPGYDAFCSTTLGAGLADGMIVACQRGNDIGRVQKGVNVKAGGAAGMILYDLPASDVATDNHFLPAVQLADGTAFLAFMAAHPTTMATFTAGKATAGKEDVVADFSSRGPAGQFLKPDITAPGVQVLAGNTPKPDDVASGPAGEYYQAISGTSMAAPAVAGAAILLTANHPKWTPGAIKSALMTTATTKLTTSAGTAADPLDMGAGRVDLSDATDVPIVFDETGANLGANAANPAAAINLNLPSVNLPTMPGSITVTRTATNVSGRAFDYIVTTSAPSGSKIKVSPSYGRIKAGGTQTFTITVTSTAPDGQYFGSIKFNSFSTPVRLPVAWKNTPGAVTLAQSCDPASIPVGGATTCTVTGTNAGTTDATVTLDSTVSSGLRISGVSGGTQTDAKNASTGSVTVPAKKDATPTVTQVSPSTLPAGGYFDLANLGVAPMTIGDQELINFTVAPFVYGGTTYTKIGVASDGYVVVGGGTSADISNRPQQFPDPTRPNGVLAPYWTDLDGTGSPGVRVASLAGSPTASWLIVQWNVHLAGSTASTAGAQRAMQVWIGLNGTQDISYTYATGTDGVGVPVGRALTVGAENMTGTTGAQITGVPSGGYRVDWAAAKPAGTVSMKLTVTGTSQCAGWLQSELTADVVLGTTIRKTTIGITRG